MIAGDKATTAGLRHSQPDMAIALNGAKSARKSRTVAAAAGSLGHLTLAKISRRRGKSWGKGQLKSSIKLLIKLSGYIC